MNILFLLVRVCVWSFLPRRIQITAIAGAMATSSDEITQQRLCPSILVFVENEIL